MKFSRVVSIRFFEFFSTSFLAVHNLSKK